MPTVGRIDGFRVVIHTNDHRPEHVHAIGTDCEAVFYLRCPDGPAELRENYGCAGHELTRIERGVNADLAALCRKWREIHGDS